MKSVENNSISVNTEPIMLMLRYEIAHTHTRAPTRTANGGKESEQNKCEQELNSMIYRIVIISFSRFCSSIAFIDCMIHIFCELCNRANKWESESSNRWKNEVVVWQAHLPLAEMTIVMVDNAYRSAYASAVWAATAPLLQQMDRNCDVFKCSIAITMAIVIAVMVKVPASQPDKWFGKIWEVEKTFDYFLE